MGRFQGLSSATCTVHARGGVRPERPSHRPPKSGVGGQLGLQGVVGSASSRELGRREASQVKKETPKLRDRWACGRRPSRTPTPPPPALIPQNPSRPPPPPALKPRDPVLPDPHSPCSRDWTPARRPSDDPSPSPESAALGCALAPPTGRSARPNAVIGLISQRREPIGCCACPFLGLAPPPRPRIPAEPRGRAPPPSAQRPARLRTRGLPAPGAQASRTSGPSDPRLSPQSPRARHAWAGSSGLSLPQLPHPLPFPRASTPSLCWLALPAGAFLAPREVSCLRPAKSWRFGKAKTSHISEAVFKACLLLKSSHIHLHFTGEHGLEFTTL